MPGPESYANTRRRPRPALIVLIVLFHVLALYGLTRAFAPTFVASVEETVVSAFTVTITAPPDPAPEPDAGVSGEQGREAVPKPVTAPPPKVRVPKNTPVPRASSNGAANTSGARDSGAGTGASGSGSGTGSGNGGGGQGGGIAAKPSVRSGELNQARDFPVPEGGRQVRFGKSVTVTFTVTADGRARDCAVASSQVDAETTARVCPLVVDKIRFNPATRADGTAVEARYGYRVDFKPL
jgi:periplasmic protein TonB